jgi:hypothetical protein
MLAVKKFDKPARIEFIAHGMIAADGSARSSMQDFSKGRAKID